MHIISLLLYKHCGVVCNVFLLSFKCWSVSGTNHHSGSYFQGPHRRVLSDFYLGYTVQSFHIIRYNKQCIVCVELPEKLEEHLLKKMHVIPVYWCRSDDWMILLSVFETDITESHEKSLTIMYSVDWVGFKALSLHSGFNAFYNSY